MQRTFTGAIKGNNTNVKKSKLSGHITQHKYSNLSTSK